MLSCQILTISGFHCYYMIIFPASECGNNKKNWAAPLLTVDRQLSTNWLLASKRWSLEFRLFSCRVVVPNWAHRNLGILFIFTLSFALFNLAHVPKSKNVFRVFPMLRNNSYLLDEATTTYAGSLNRSDNYVI